MANVRKDVIGPDGKSGMKGREIIARVVERDEKNGKGYYMNAQLNQSFGKPVNTTSQPHLAKAHSFKGNDGTERNSYDIRLGPKQVEALKANSKSCTLEDGSTIYGFTADLMKTKDNGLMPDFGTLKPTSKKIDDKSWAKQSATTQKAFKAGEAQRAAKAAEKTAEAPAKDDAQAEIGG